MVSHFLDSCFRRNDIEQPKSPLTVIPVKTGIHFQELHKMLVYKKVRKYSLLDDVQVDITGHEIFRLTNTLPCCHNDKRAGD